ncbi:MAG: cyclodeaminase/cyclohydrolase family protein [Vulcanimicrobiaceae bacterium]
MEQYLTTLASDAPAPGGGSAATIVAAAGASLVAMVARICGANPRYAAQSALASDLVLSADRLRERLLAARERDESAFAAVVAAQALPKTDERRAGLLETALAQAAREPLDGARLALDVLLLAERALEIPNRNLASDLGCAAEFGYAALNACAYNVRVNHRFMHDPKTIEEQAERLSAFEREATAIRQRVRDGVNALLSR